MALRGLLGFGVLILFIDQLSKLLTHFYLPLMGLHTPFYPYGGLPVFSDFLGIEFSISHTVNTGAAWGLFSQWQFPLVLLRIFLICGLFCYLVYGKAAMEQRFPIVLIASGALSNVIDTLFYGHVVDMLHFVFWGYDYPVFNIADAAIFVGVVWLVLLSLKSDIQASRGS